MSKEKIEALYDVIIKNTEVQVVPTKTQFVSVYINLSPEKREEMISEYKKYVPADGFGGVSSFWGGETNATKQAAIDAAVIGANKEAVLEKDKVLEEKRGKVINLLKAATKQVIEANRKEKGLEGKKTTFADVTINASKNQRDREDSFMTYVGAGNLGKAREMLFEGEHPMTVTPKFVAKMEEKDSDSPVLKLLYERQLKTELDKKIVGRMASKETIKALAEKVSPDKVQDVKINGVPMLTYVALNNPNAVARVSRVEGITAENKKEALIAVANRSQTRANRSETRVDYNAALDLVANGAQAAVSDLTISSEASQVLANDIRNLVKISSYTAVELSKSKDKNPERQQAIDLEERILQINDTKRRKNIHKGAKEGGKYLKDGAVKYGTLAAKGAGAIAGGAVLATGAAIAGAGVGAAYLAGAGYNAASAGMKKYQPLKKTGRAIAASPAAIAAGVQATILMGATAAYYNVAKLGNGIARTSKDVGSALNVPKNILQKHREYKLDSKQKEVETYMENMLNKHFKTMRDVKKKNSANLKKDDPEAYKKKKLEIDAEINDMKAPLELEFKTLQENHNKRIDELANGGNFKDDNGLPITDRKVIANLIEKKMYEMAIEKAMLFDKIEMDGPENFASINRQKLAMETFKNGRVRSLSESGNTLWAEMQDSIESQEKIQDKLKVLASDCKSMTKRVVKEYKIKADHIERIAKQEQKDIKISHRYDAKWEREWNSTKDTFNTIINAEKGMANAVLSMFQERKTKKGVEEQLEQVVNNQELPAPPVPPSTLETVNSSKSTNLVGIKDEKLPVPSIKFAESLQSSKVTSSKNTPNVTRDEGLER